MILRKNIVIASLLASVLILSAYVAVLGKEIRNLKIENTEKQSKIDYLKVQAIKTPSKIQLKQTEDKIIEEFKKTATYKKEESYVPPYVYIAFDNFWTNVDDNWAFGAMNYYALYKEDNSNVYKQGKPIPSIADGFHFIVKLDALGHPQKVIIRDAANKDEWNENLSQLPESVLPTNERSSWKYSGE